MHSVSRLRAVLCVLALVAGSAVAADTVLDDFERASGWAVRCADRGSGIRTALSFREGAPYDLRELGQKRVLGVKLEFLEARGFRVDVLPARPIPLSGAHSLAVWVYGSNMDHELWVQLEDRQGVPVAGVYLGTLGFYGWKELHLAVPDELQGIPLSLAGFSIRCDPLDLRRGVLYVYFDQLTITGDGEKP